MGGYIIAPIWRREKDQPITHCAPEPADWADEPNSHWSNLRYASRQLYSEIGSCMFFEESVVRFKPGPFLWRRWLDTWSREQLWAVNKVQILVQPYWKDPRHTIIASLTEIGMLPNLHTLYVKEAFQEMDVGAKQDITASAQRQGWKVVFERA